MIIVIGGYKGGVGKTTIAASLIPLFKDVYAIDCDKSKNLTCWITNRFNAEDLVGINSAEMSGGSIIPRIKKAKNKYENIIIDVAGQDYSKNIELLDSLMIADIAIFPLRPEQYDTWSMLEIDKTVQTCKIINNKLKAVLVISQASTNIKTKNVEEFLMGAKEFPEVQVLKTIIHTRQAYSKANKYGKSVIELEGTDGKARSEIISLRNEILKIVGDVND